MKVTEAKRHRIRLRPATPEQAAAIAVLRMAVAQHLTERHGKGPWSSSCTERGVRYDMRNAAVYVATQRGNIIATLTLCTRKPWAIDRKYFTTCAKPLYLVGMAVSPELQRAGIGRLCVEEAKRIARQWPSDGIRLDAYDAEAGAGEFYRRCGFTEAGRASYRDTPLIYFELLL